ncbi:tRNA-splicing endonuclease subunit Sen54 isoform X2 [Ambystoma mexicanum]|uniref:tRNA-splicing endonuclease subunit Sen54 isoform X2 n=1 Tax=Ambystoma mexicanum TaxID=8296 RepID=UPI0037E96B90
MSGFPGNIKPADLFAARSREHSLPQRTHGQKDFICDYSEAQAEKLRLCREEQWQLLSEERVERLGSLVKAKWKPRKGIVELKSAAGKFWHTMGFTRHGKQCLQPEEAIYLLECGSIQLFYRDLPLSIQEAYERLLLRGTGSLLQYQVFSHLKRLGYILMRFDPSTVLSPYERQLNMECSRHKSGGNRRRKRKRSPSPGYQDKKGKINEHVFDEETNREGTFRNATVRLGIPVVNSDWPEKLCASNGAELVKTCVDNVKDDTQASMEDKCPISQPAIPKDTNGGCSPRWGFTEITFPNLGSDCMQNHLPQPDGVLLPKNIIGREVDLSSWRHRLNQKRERISRREQEQLEWESRYKNSVNADLEVKQCRNWREYKELLRGRISRGAKKRPPHLWNQAVTPLVEPGQVTSSAFLLEQIGILQTSRILDGSARLQKEAEEIKIDFDVYQADAVADFKKSNPGKPYARMCVRRFDEVVPDLQALKKLARRSGDVPVVFALVDSGDIAFYSFKDFNLPIDIYP